METIRGTEYPINIETGQEMEHKYLTFFCDSQLFAVSIAHVMQIIGMQNITPIPESPDYIKGVINLRDSIISVIDTRRRLKKAEQEYDDRTCIIITTVDDIEIGLIVDRVDEVLDIEEGTILSPPKVSSDGGCDYVVGIVTIRNKTILILDVEGLISGNDLDQLRLQKTVTEQSQ